MSDHFGTLCIKGLTIIIFEDCPREKQHQSHFAKCCNLMVLWIPMWHKATHAWCSKIFCFKYKFIGKWTLESKSEYIVENNIYHLVIFQKCICFCYVIYNQVYWLVNRVIISCESCYDTPMLWIHLLKCSKENEPY